MLRKQLLYWTSFMLKQLVNYQLMRCVYMPTNNVNDSCYILPASTRCYISNAKNYFKCQTRILQCQFSSQFNGVVTHWTRSMYLLYTRPG